MSKQTSMYSFFTAKKKAPAVVAAAVAVVAKQAEPVVTIGAEAIGRRIKVFWVADDAWYEGEVTKFVAGKHAVLYDDGETEELELDNEKYELLGLAPPRKDKGEEEGMVFQSSLASSSEASSSSSVITAEQRARAERNRLEAKKKRELRDSTQKAAAVDDDMETTPLTGTTGTPASDNDDDEDFEEEDDEDDAEMDVDSEEEDEEHGGATTPAPKRRIGVLKKKRRTIAAEEDDEEECAVVTGSGTAKKARRAAPDAQLVTPRVAGGNGSPWLSAKTPSSQMKSSIKERFSRGSQPPMMDESSVRATPRNNGFTEMYEDEQPRSIESATPSVYAAGAHMHDVEAGYGFLNEGNEKKRDAQGNKPTDPGYDHRTLKLTKEWEAMKLSEVQQQWWRLKATHHDCVLFFKIGKFYELYHTDSDLGVKEAGLVYMKGAQAHSGFPEIAYGRKVETLVAKGFKVARVEQTETPDENKIRVKREKELATKGKRRAVTKAEQAMRREVCSLTTPGTRMYTVLDMRSEKEGGGFEGVHGPTLLVAISEKKLSATRRSYGVCVVDAPTGQFTMAEFEDDAQRTRLRTMLLAFPPAEILVERGGAELVSMLNIAAKNATVEQLAPTTEFMTASATTKHLDGCGAFPRASKDNATDLTDGQRAARWPRVLRSAVANGADLAVAALGAVCWWLQRGLIDVELLSMRRFNSYAPPDTDNDNESTMEVEESSGEFMPYDETELDAAIRAVDNPDQLEDDEEGGPIDGRAAPRLALDATTLKNLEVLESAASDGRKGSLWSLFDKVVVTPFGSRQLRSWLAQPLMDVRDIAARSEAVAELVNDRPLADNLRAKLKKIPDLERLLQQLHTLGAERRAKVPDDFALEQHPDSRAVLFETAKFNMRKVQQLVDAVKGLQRCDALFPRSSEGEDEEEPVEWTSALLKKCGCLPELEPQLRAFNEGFDLEAARRTGQLEARPGADDAFDAARHNVKEAKQALDEWLRTAKKEMRCGELEFTVGRDRYHVKVPESYFSRSQQVDNADFKVSKWEQKKKTKAGRAFEVVEVQRLVGLLEQAEKRVENAKLDQLRSVFAAFDSSRGRWAAAVKCVATLDCLLSLAHVSRREGFCRAEVVAVPAPGGDFIEIRDGAHPCLHDDDSSDGVITNDVSINSEKKMMLLSGPNMGGKSTLLRHVCCSTLLAQTGCFVRASSCRLTPADRIFTRLGASDKILEGQSTFMVEMLETALILRQARPSSLVILDELGRGTATFDGAAIAHAVVHHLVTKIDCRCLFATHYHDLVESWSDDPRVQLGHMDCVVQEADKIVFLYKLAQGVSPKSFGVNVARLAKLPLSVLKRAQEKSADFEAVVKAKKLLALKEQEQANKEQAN